MVVTVVLVLLVAGCFGGTGTPTEGPGSPTEAPTATATPTATAVSFEDVSQPPGVDRSGVTDVDGLVSAHAATLTGTSATVDLSFYLAVNGSERNVSLTGKVVPDGDRGWMEVGLPDGVGTYYTADGTTYVRKRVDGDVQYGTTDQVSAIPETPRFGTDERVRTAIAAAEWEPVGTVERDGRTLLAFQASSVDPPNVNTSGDTTVNSSGRLLVDERGVVHHVSVRTTVEQPDGSVTYALEVSLTGVGSTTIEEPDWISRAR